MPDAKTTPDKEAPRLMRSLMSELAFLCAPFVFSGICALAGALVLVALVTPQTISGGPVDLPLALLEASHFVSSVIGTLLLVLSAGIRQRLRTAWLLAVIAFVLLAVLSLTAGRDVWLAAVLGLAAAGLAATRSAFYRKGAISRIGLSAEPLIALGLLLAGIVWLGFFAYRNVDYSSELWWTFAMKADASRFLRALIAIISVAVIFLFWKLLQPGGAPRLPKRTPELDARLEQIIRAPQTSSADAALAWLHDKRFVFSEDDTAFVMYGVRGRTWIVKGPPVGPAETARNLAFQMKRAANDARARLVFYAVSGTFLPVALDLGLTARKIGETALVPLERFTLEGPKRAPLRHAVNRMKREEARFEVLPAGSASAHLEQMKAVSDAWLAHHAGAEKAFTLGRFDAAYLDHFPIACLWQGDRLLAFANIWQAGDGRTMAIDLMRSSPDAPPMSMDALFASLALWGREQGCEWFDLGMAPLSGLAGEREANSLSRLGNFIYDHGGGVYGFEGLRRFKQKFDPHWEPLYLCGPANMNLAFALADVAILTSGGLRGMLARPKSGAA